jgi:glycosyltransferase involved in cell wall biosynthesis
VYNGVDTTFFKPSILHSIFIHNKPVIVFVGRLIQAKGVQDLLDATKNIECWVDIIGEGPYKKELENIAKGRPEVEFFGLRNKEEIKNILDDATIFCNTSYAEGLPTSVLEAGAMGLPIIATNVGGTNEIIDAGHNGFLVDPKNIDGLKFLIKALLLQDGICKMFGRRIRKKIVQKFDWDKSAKKFIQLLKKIRPSK